LKGRNRENERGEGVEEEKKINEIRRRRGRGEEEGAGGKWKKAEAGIMYYLEENEKGEKE
jgi:hypothetical protein